MRSSRPATATVPPRGSGGRGGVGGLRRLVGAGRPGFLIGGRPPASYASAVATLLGDPGLATAMGRAGTARASRYTWSTAAARLRRLYGDLVARTLVDCS